MKTFKKTISIVLVVVLTLAFWAGCAPKFTVKFDSKGGSSVESVRVDKDGLVTKPTDPTYEGYIFSGWYKDSDCTKEWNFETDKVTENITIYAKWMTYTEKVTEALNNMDKYVPEGLNTYTATFEEMVAYLKEKGLINADDAGVDMQTNDGYLKNNSTQSYEGYAPFADKAYAYGDLWLIWWDMDNGSQFASFYNSLAMSDNTIVVGGGQYVMPTIAVSGYFAINYKPIALVQNETWNGEGVYEEWDAAKKANVASKKAEFDDKLKVFADIDNHKVKLSQYSAADIAAAFRTEGLLGALDIAQAKNLNEEYKFKAGDMEYNVALANEAMSYGKITIYYFNTSDSLWDFYTFKPMFDNLKENKTTNVYYGQWNYIDTANPDNSLYKYDANKMYSAEGTQLTYSVDFIIGKFAFSIAE